MKCLNPWKTFVLFLIISFVSVNSSFAKQPTNEGNADREFIELSPSDIKPPFTQKTVLKLNAIVRLSYDAINEFDRILEETRSTISDVANSNDNTVTSTKNAQQKVKKIHELDQVSKSALEDIMSAANKLRNSDEEYNNAILEGMIQFVEEVEKEISQEKTHLDTLLESV